MRTHLYTIAIILFTGLTLMAQSGPIGQGNTYSNKSIGLDPVVQSQPFTPNGITNDTDGEAPGGEQERLVYWVHGLSGNQSAWARAAFASEHGSGAGFPARQLRSITDVTYLENLDMKAAAHQADQKLAAYVHLGGEPDKNFCVAHSQGGIVTRSMAHVDHCYQGGSAPNFGGYVTYGTPNQGALILNNADLFENLISDLCAAMAEGPLKAEALNTGQVEFTILGFEINFNLRLHELVTEQNISTFCNVFSGFFTPLARIGLTPPITEDYEVGAGWLQEMEDCESEDLQEMPKMAFYGVEPAEGLMFRTAQWFLTNPNSEPTFNANGDNDFTEMFQQNLMRFMDERDRWEERYQVASNAYHSKKCYTAARYYWVSCVNWRIDMKDRQGIIDAFQRGIDGLNRADDQYKLIIGALQLDQVWQQQCWMREYQRDGSGQYGPWVMSHVINPANPACQPTDPLDENIYEMRRKMVVKRTEFDSDGVVLAESASDLPDATWTPQRLDNSSHMQMRNDENTRRTLSALYRGSYHPFFKTEER